MLSASTLVAAVRDRYRRWRVGRRRRKLIALYGKEARVRYGLGPGFTQTMYAYERLTDEGLADFEREDGETRLSWNWPDEEVSTDA